MAELPEIYLIAQQMQAALPGKAFAHFEIIQPKCLNVEPGVFSSALGGACIEAVNYRGKWVQAKTDRGWLLLCLGMGGEILLVDRSHLPEKRRLVFDFQDGSCLAVNFWWFGYAHYAAQRSEHEMTARLGPNAIDLSPDDLQRLLTGRRGKLKAWLLDQSQIAGIGNFYIHDILFQARLHPLRPIQSLTPAEAHALASAIEDRLKLSIQKGGFAYEQNLYGQKGGFSMDDLLIGYKENQPCPACGTSIQKIKTGSTGSFICPACQPL
ncbi:MAG: Fpg/Nei family DNA glycosylase [Chloroflexota bacterium]